MAEDRIIGLAAAALAGLLVGSFLNVCIYRVPRDLSVVFPRSFCPQCGVQIAAFDNIPVFSFLFLRGRCRSCGSPIRWRYPAVELTTAALMTLVMAKYGWSVRSLKWMIFECLMVILFWTDLEERILPYEFTFGGAALGLVFAWFVPLQADLLQFLLPDLSRSWLSVADAAIGALFFAGLFWGCGAIWSRIAGREAMGGGDIHLLLLLGSFLGFEHEIPGLMIGAVGGSLAGGAYLLIKRKELRSFELPLGSFLCLGAGIMPLIQRFS